MLTPSFLQ